MSDTDPNPENPIKNIHDMNRQESAEGDGGADRGADDIPLLNLDEMLSGSCPTTSSARNGGIAIQKKKKKKVIPRIPIPVHLRLQLLFQREMAPPSKRIKSYWTKTS